MGYKGSQNRSLKTFTNLSSFKLESQHCVYRFTENAVVKQYVAQEQKTLCYPHSNPVREVAARSWRTQRFWKLNHLCPFTQITGRDSSTNKVT